MSAVQGHSVRRYFPFLNWWWMLKDRKVLRADALAGLTGAIVVLPQGVAFATLAGMPAQYGLYAAMVPCIIAALFGSSRVMVTGPANAISLTVLALVAPLAAAESPRYIVLVLTLTLMVGVWQLLLGLSKAGRLVEYVSHTVIVGFTAGAAVLIINSQIGNFFGLAIPRGTSVWATVNAFFHSLTAIHWPTAVVGGVTLAAGIVSKRWNHIVPYMLTAIVAGSVCAVALHAPGVRTVAALPGPLPAFSMPEFSFETFRALLFASLVMTLLAVTEALSIAQAMAKKKHHKLDANQELIGQGLANVAGAFFSSYPASGSFSRTGVNIAANALTPFSAICASVFLVVLLLFVGPLAQHLPYAALAAVLFLVAYQLVDQRELRHLWQDRHERIVLLGTFVATVTLSLEWAILFGIALSLVVKKLR
jgi:sulfate permease, SulP family